MRKKEKSGEFAELDMLIKSQISRAKEIHISKIRAVELKFSEMQNLLDKLVNLSHLSINQNIISTPPFLLIKKLFLYF